MKFSKALEEGIFLKRWKRFFAEIEWRGERIVAHVANTGSMKGCHEAGRPCRFSVSDDPKRKLKYSLEMIQVASGAWVGVNTSTPNKIVAEALEAKLLPHWKDFSAVKAEYKVTPETRFDFACFKMRSDKIHFIEVKNVTLCEGDLAQFPDAVTERGQKHLRELMRLVGEGHTAEVVFTVQHEAAERFSPAVDIDPDYATLYEEAATQGVRMTPLKVRLSRTEVVLEPAYLQKVTTCPSANRSAAGEGRLRPK